jgi:hypothetical protein
MPTDLNPVGDPEAVMADNTLSTEQKRERLTLWRDRLKADKETCLGSGEGHRLIQIERALAQIDRAAS